MAALIIGVQLLTIGCASTSPPVPPTIGTEILCLLETNPPFVVTDDAAKDKISIAIVQSAFWEPGVDEDVLGDHLLSVVQLEIDGQSVPEEEMFILVITTIHAIWDCEQNPIGAVGGELVVVFSKAYLEAGNHTGKIQATNLSGQLFSYSWDFSVNP